jgi:aldehyde:ferredoxin oxidoreductase
VACTDQDNRYPARHAARGGLGAVMGKKGLKYVMIDPGRAPVRQPADRTGFADLCKSYTKDYLDGPQMFKKGTSAVVPAANALHTFPHKNRTSGQSPDVETLDGARINESFAKRGGKMHNCMTGCIVKCSNVVNDAQGRYKTSALEFETLTLLGSNCAIASWEDVADLDRLCDEVGLDTIETGAAIAIYMDAGKMAWGDTEGAKRLIEEIAAGTELGRVIGDGAVATGKYTGHHRVPESRGQAIPAWDPRPLKATGVTYCTSAMGADHTAGLVVNPGLGPAEMAWESQKAQIVNAVCDSSGFCQFLQTTLDDIRSFYAALYGTPVSREAIHDLGWQCLSDEWEFNDGAGFTDADDKLADCMYQDAIGNPPTVFDVPREIIQAAKQRMPAREDLFGTKASG